MNSIISHLIDTLIFKSNIWQYTKCKCMRVQLENYCMVCANLRAIIHSLKLVDDIPVHARIQKVLSEGVQLCQRL